MLQIGSIVDGKYKILNKIGQGGMSIVYLAMNERANKQWAIKEIRRDAARGRQVVKQSLIAEIDILKKIRHPHLPSIIDVIEQDGTFLIVMDYIEGNTLKHALKESGAQNQEEVIQWSIQLCDVLSYLHIQNPPIVYRDLKPSNVMLKPDGNVMLIDFGSARTFKKNSVDDTTCLGTQGYAAPEQYQGRGQTDGRTDIYCLGATMYHLVTGHNPCEPPYEMYPIREWNPKLSSGLEEIIIKCTQRNPEDRYQSCAELRYELEHYMELDIESRIMQKRKLRLFLASIAISLLGALGAKGFYMAETTTRKNTYDQYLLDAKSLSNKEEQFFLYEKAINLRPGEGEAYVEMLDKCFLEDGNFTSDEEKKLRKILGVPEGKNNSNESSLKLNIQAYEEFASRAAMAYFYYFTGSDNKNGAIKWLETVKNASTLERNIIERGKRLEKIAEYYSTIGIQNLEGDASITYLDFWEDLKELTQGNLAEADNAKTALVMYEELVGQICNNCERFKHAGVTKQDILSQISNAEERLDTDIIMEQEGNRKMLEVEIKEIRKNISLAKRITDSVYQFDFRKKGLENAGN